MDLQKVGGRRYEDETMLIHGKKLIIFYRLYFQLSTEWTQLEVIDLINDGTGLGFGIIGGKSTGVIVKTILPGGVADRVSLSGVVFDVPKVRSQDFLHL